MFATEQIRRIQDKLQQLLKQHSALQKENSQLKEELENNRKAVSEQQKNIEALRQQMDVLKLNAGQMNEADKKEFEKRINGYLKEIDRCIAMLSE